jgi:phosphoribosylaminoimidazolecarboxamide formyltransferase/IMP cyclohydrolase
LAEGLVRAGFSLLSTGGTLAALEVAGIRATKVSAHTGFPEILGGRVKTLHPKIHGGLLGRPTLATDRAELEAHGIAPISLVVVNLYPFRETVAKGATRREVIEQIDIGGPAMVRASAKNADHVSVVVDPDDYAHVLAEITRDGRVGEVTRRRLQRKAFAHTAAYDAAIAAYLTDQERAESESANPDAGKPDSDVFPELLTVSLEKAQDLRYGENPHQRGAFYRVTGQRPSEPTVAFSKVLQGKELSYNNLLDLDAALGLVLEFPERATSVIIKHNTPCGVASDDSLVAAYRRARAIDETSAFGGIVALNRRVDETTAQALVETFLEAVIAPAYDDRALEVLSTKKNLRLLEAGPGLAEKDVKPLAQIDARSVSGGMLFMDRDAVEPTTPWKVVTKRAPSEAELSALRFAWRVCKHVKSNAIVFADATHLLAVGGGQTSRVDSVKIAAARGGHALKGSAVASDAFFPFRDGLDALGQAGAGAVIQPGGSVRDAEVIAAADEFGIAMVFTGVRHFRH